MKIFKFLEDSGLLIKAPTKTIENEIIEQKCRFLGMLLCILGGSLLGNMLAVNTVKQCTVNADKQLRYT